MKIKTLATIVTILIINQQTAFAAKSELTDCSPGVCNIKNVKSKKIVGSWFDRLDGCVWSLEEVEKRYFQVYRCIVDGELVDGLDSAREFKKKNHKYTMLINKNIEYIIGENGSLTIYENGNPDHLPAHTELWPEGNSNTESKIAIAKSEFIRLRDNIAEKSVDTLILLQIKKLRTIKPTEAKYAEAQSLILQYETLHKSKSDEKTTRKSIISEQFSTLSGAHKSLEQKIRAETPSSLNFKHIESRHWDRGDHLIVIMKYEVKEKNSNTQNKTVKAKINLRSNSIEILSRE